MGAKSLPRTRIERMTFSLQVRRATTTPTRLVTFVNGVTYQGLVRTFMVTHASSWNCRLMYVFRRYLRLKPKDL
jgi:hypothetical protein